MTDTTPTKGADEALLCMLAEEGERRFDLYRKGEAFHVRARGTEGQDRVYESLPALLAGLQSFFLEFRVAASPAKGFAELASAQEKAKSDVINASRRIYAAIDGTA